ncbi:hypothetical protein GCM10009128_24940 [Psychrosphaera haliotis]|uniref:PEP-CTERM sorting domain-containing protein n=1 Tax=Psychrosphaera haliotis TaxID=555083 RepID=UPI0031E1ACBD
MTSKLLKIGLTSLILLFTSIANASVITDPLEDKIVTVNNLDWVWASPCAGRCSQLVSNWEYAGGLYTDTLNTQLDVSIWRFANQFEWAMVPAPALFQNPDKCASSAFDATYSHCDFSDRRVSEIDFSVAETMLVRTNNVSSNVNAVSEPSTLALFGLTILGLASRRLKKQA